MIVLRDYYHSHGTIITPGAITAIESNVMDIR